MSHATDMLTVFKSERWSGEVATLPGLEILPDTPE